jgi:hypothetical protein
MSAWTCARLAIDLATPDDGFVTAGGLPPSAAGAGGVEAVSSVRTHLRSVEQT